MMEQHGVQSLYNRKDSIVRDSAPILELDNVSKDIQYQREIIFVVLPVEGLGEAVVDQLMLLSIHFIH